MLYRMDGAPQSTERDFDWVEARAITDQIKSDVVRARKSLGAAYWRRAWAALGYESWDVYCEKELAGTGLRMPREERIKEVWALREDGLSTRAIAAATGVSEGTVRNDLAAGAQNYAPAEEPPIRGLDGKDYPTPKAKRKRKPKPPNTFTYKYECTVDSIETNALRLKLLSTDKNFPLHRDEMIRRCRDHILSAQEDLAEALEQLTSEQCDLGIAV